MIIAKDYMVVTGSTRKDLIAKVKEWIEEGWEPNGGVATSIDEPPKYMQALVKRKDV